MILIYVLWYWLLFAVRGRTNSRAALLRAKHRRLTRKLAWVIQHIPFYRRVPSPDLDAFPLISKSVFNAHFADLNVAGIARETAYAFALEAEQTGRFRARLRGLTVGLSTGTSGNRGVFLLTNREIAQWVALVFVRVLRINPCRRTRIAFVFRTNSNLYQSASAGRVTMRFFPLDVDSPAALATLNAFGPTVLVGQPSVLMRLAAYRQRGELTIRPSRIISVAEVLDDRDRQHLTRVFGQLIHQVYQCMEGFLASTCQYGNLHLNEDVIHVEKRYVDAEKRRYHPILTDFTRRTQALIRYELNDILVEPDAPCPCRSPFMSIGRIEGRADDVLAFHDQTGRPVLLFPDAVRRAVCDSSDAILNYDVLQTAPTTLAVGLEADLLADEYLCQTIRTNLTALLTGRAVSGITIAFLPYQPPEPGAKLRRIKRHPAIAIDL